MSDPEVYVHPSASVHPKAQIDSGVRIGPFSVIGEKSTIHKGTRIDAHVCLSGIVEIGEDCHFSPYTVIGTEPQDVSYKGEETRVKIGDRNFFREFMTVHRATARGRGITTIGNDNYFMAYSHIAHDCLVGNNTIFLHQSTLGGHVTIEDYATMGAISGVHQFCRIGKYAFIGGFSTITQDVVPFAKVAGSRPVLFFGMNGIGLRRRGFSKERTHDIKEMFKILFYSNLNTTQALEQIQARFPQNPDQVELIQFIQSSKRGIIKKSAEQWQIDSES
jgi:UDP-N-acetylglucosamine acyltransferase